MRCQPLMFYLFVLWLALALSAGNVPTAGAATYLVRPDGSGDFPTIQAAVNAAVAGDVILLADGTFSGSGNRDVSFLGKGITIRSQSGDPAGCVLDCQGSASENHRAFLLASQEDTTSVVVGLTLTGGFVPNGGAVYCVGTARAKLVGCIVTGNTALYDGGGAYSDYDYYAGLVLDNCRFISNSARKGGGACISQGGFFVSRVDGCTFSGNAAEDGGGLAQRTGRLRGSVFLANSALGEYNQGGGGAWLEFVEVDGCRFEGNSTNRYGGGAYVYSSPSMAGCCFTANTAYAGGGISLVGSPLRSATVAGNSASSWAGGIHASGGTIEVTSCTVTDNTALDGSALGAEGYSDVWIDRCIVAFNHGVAFVHSHHSVIEADCSDFYGNEGGNGSVSVYEEMIYEDPLFCGEANPASPYTLWEASPCAPEQSPFCGLIGAWPVGCSPTVSQDDPVAAASGLGLRVTPNPAHGVVRIGWAIPGRPTSPAEILVLDVTGRLVWSCVAAQGSTGSCTWNGADLAGVEQPDGIYYCRLRVGSTEEVAKIVRLR